jgi:hypothetical protein
MRLGEGLSEMARHTGDGGCFEIFTRHIDVEWVRRALEHSEAASVRRRKLPAVFVVWLVIGMALLRDRSIEEVVGHLDLVLPDRRGARRAISEPAIVRARDRLGFEPMIELFEATATRWAGESAAALCWHGLRVYGIDGTHMTVPDTLDNDAFFGRPQTSRATAGYPQLRVVALMVLRSHLLAAVAAGPYAVGEFPLAQFLIDLLAAHSLLIIDRGFFSYLLFQRITSRAAHWLIRNKRRIKYHRLRLLGPGDELVEITPHRSLRRLHPELPRTFAARAIHYHIPGFRPEVLLTSLLDPHAYPAAEIIKLYHERWELEMGFDEIKTHALERQESLLRSKTPTRVTQELWGILLAYNLLRLEMEHVARLNAVPPNRISFRHALMLVRNFLVSAWLAAPGVLPRRLDSLHQEIRLLILPPRRKRAYPRAVKIKMSTYLRKPPRSASPP